VDYAAVPPPLDEDDEDPDELVDEDEAALSPLVDLAESLLEESLLEESLLEESVDVDVLDGVFLPESRESVL